MPRVKNLGTIDWMFKEAPEFCFDERTLPNDWGDKLLHDIASIQADIIQLPKPLQMVHRAYSGDNPIVINDAGQYVLHICLVLDEKPASSWDKVNEDVGYNAKGNVLGFCINHPTRGWFQGDLLNTGMWYFAGPDDKNKCREKEESAKRWADNIIGMLEARLRDDKDTYDRLLEAGDKDLADEKYDLDQYSHHDAAYIMKVLEDLVQLEPSIRSAVAHLARKLHSSIFYSWKGGREIELDIYSPDPIRSPSGYLKALARKMSQIVQDTKR